MTLLDAALDYYVAQRGRALANLEVYLRSPQAIGEHSDLVEEVVKLVDQATHADDCIKVICRLSGRPYLDPMVDQRQQNLPGI